MPNREKTINGLMCIAGDVIFCAHCKYSDVNGSGRGDRCKCDCAKDAIDLLKEHEKATIEPKRIDLADDTKAWLDKMDAVDVLRNIADICMDWDGHRTANGLGALINEIWAYARCCANRLQKVQEPRVMTLEEAQTALHNDDVVWVELKDKKICGGIRMDGTDYFTMQNGDVLDVTDFDSGEGAEMYGKEVRCWTSRPSEAQMEAVKWDGAD